MKILREVLMTRHQQYIFLRFELDQTDITDFLSNDRVLVGVSHDEYTDEVVLSEATKDSLSKDLNTN